MDKEDEEGVVEDDFEGFQQMYKPIIENQFKDVMELREGKLYLDHDDRATRRLLAMHVNDNVYKNLKSFSPMLFDENQRYSKEEFDHEEKSKIVDKLIDKTHTE